MREISIDDLHEVSGGAWPLAATALFIYYERENIRDFMGGVLDGFNDTEHMRPE